MCFRAFPQTTLALYMLSCSSALLYCPFEQIILKLQQKIQHMALEEGREKGYFLNARIQTTEDAGVTLLVNLSYDSNHCQRKHIMMEVIKICVHSLIGVTIG